MSREAAPRLVRAVLVPGPRPDVHAEQVRRLAQEWPALAGALAQFIQEEGQGPPREWQRPPSANVTP